MINGKIHSVIFIVFFIGYAMDAKATITMPSVLAKMMVFPAVLYKKCKDKAQQATNMMFMKAVYKNDICSMKMWLLLGADIHHKDSAKRTVLRRYLSNNRLLGRRGNAVTVRWLVKHGSFVDDFDVCEASIMPSREGFDIFRFLLSSVKIGLGKYAQEALRETNNLQSLKLLLEYGVPFKDNRALAIRVKKASQAYRHDREEQKKSIKLLTYVGMRLSNKNKPLDLEELEGIGRAKWCGGEIQHIITKPWTIKHYCTQEEIEGFDSIMEKRRASVIKNFTTDFGEKNIVKSLRDRELRK